MQYIDKQQDRNNLLLPGVAMSTAVPGLGLGFGLGLGKKLGLDSDSDSVKKVKPAHP